MCFIYTITVKKKQNTFFFDKITHNIRNSFKRLFKFFHIGFS